MEESRTYLCNKCGRKHEGWPALAYTAPVFYDNLSEEEKQEIGELDNDFCMIRHENQADRFIRCTLTQKVTDHCENLEYGLWVSVREKSYQDYTDNFKNENHITTYFGWLSNDVPQYGKTTSIPTTVYTKAGDQRPEIVPHRDFHHPFVRDYYQGITKDEVERRIQAAFGEG
jgi:hypothetical protein